MNATEIIQAIQNNESISRWDVLLHQKEIKRIIRSNPDKYESIFEEILDIIESAKESL